MGADDRRRLAAKIAAITDAREAVFREKVRDYLARGRPHADLGPDALAAAWIGAATEIQRADIDAEYVLRGETPPVEKLLDEVMDGLQLSLGLSPAGDVEALDAAIDAKIEDLVAAYASAVARAS